MAKNKKPRLGRPLKTGNVLATVSASIDPLLIEALNLLCEKERRTRSQLVAFLIEEAMRARELWPPTKKGE